MLSIFYVSAAILAVARSEMFAVSDTLTGDTIDIAIDIGAATTTVTITTSLDVSDLRAWGLGFGGTTMDGTYAIILTPDIANQAMVITEHTLSSSRSAPAISGADNWSSTFTLDGLTSAIIELTRDNDVSGLCADCFTFDPAASSLDVVYAKSNAGEGFTGHTPDNRVGVTLQAVAPTDEPTTAAPASADTPSPVTPAPVTPAPVAPSGPATFSVSDTLDGTDIDIVIEIDTDTTTVTVTTPLGDTNDIRAWGLGFGGKTMDGTYALLIVPSLTAVTVTEATLSASRSYSAISGADNWSTEFALSGDVIFTLTRDNDVSDSCTECFTFDPTASTLDIVYAKSNAGDGFTGHTAANRVGVTLTAGDDGGNDGGDDAPTSEPETTEADAAYNIFNPLYVALVALSLYFMA